MMANSSSRENIYQQNEKKKKCSNKFRIVQSILAIENLNKLLKIVQLIRYFACRTHNDLV